MKGSQCRHSALLRGLGKERCQGTLDPGNGLSLFQRRRRRKRVVSRDFFDEFPPGVRPQEKFQGVFFTIAIVGNFRRLMLSNESSHARIMTRCQPTRHDPKGAIVLFGPLKKRRQMGAIFGDKQTQLDARLNESPNMNGIMRFREGGRFFIWEIG